MANTSHSANILIAGLPDLYDNYEQTLSNSGFHVLYPEHPTTGAPFILSQLIDINFDLLLLPGGGDISPLLYVRSDDKPAKSDFTQPDYVTDLLQFQLLQLALLRKKPVLGICKGMQLLNVWFGGDLYPHLPTSDTHLSPQGDLTHPLLFASHIPNHCRIFGCDRDISQKLYDLLTQTPVVNSAHHQGVRTLGKHMITLQYSNDFLPETIAHRYLPILGLQWHPERLPGFRDNDFKKLIQLLLQSSVL